MDNATILVMLKWLAPSFMGSVMALYKRAKDVELDDLKTSQKVKLVLLGFGGLIMSIYISYLLGGSILEAFHMQGFNFRAMLIYFVLSFSALKLVDAVAENLDLWIDKLANIVSTIIDNLSKYVNRWFK